MINPWNRAAPLRRAARRAALIGLTLSLGAAYLPSAQAQTTVFDFTGNCTDCSGVGTGVLTLQDYTAGAAIDPNNFVSLTYASNLTTFSVTDSELAYTLAPTAATGAQSYVSSMGPGSSYLITTSGSLNPGLLPGPADFSLEAALSYTSATSVSTEEVLFETCKVNCATGAWYLSVVEQVSVQQPGGGAGEIKDYGASHSWSVASAPEIDGTTAASGLTLLLGSLVLLIDRVRREKSPGRPA